MITESARRYATHEQMKAHVRKCISRAALGGDLDAVDKCGSMLRTLESFDLLAQYTIEAIPETPVTMKLLERLFQRSRRQIRRYLKAIEKRQPIYCDNGDYRPEVVTLLAHRLGMAAPPPQTW